MIPNSQPLESKTDHYRYIRGGINSRLDTLQAAVLLVKFNVIDQEIAARQMIANRKNALLTGNYVSILTINVGSESFWDQYTIRVFNREKVRNIFDKINIPNAIHYLLTIYRQSAAYIENLYI
jgi:UDP-2-acetamido-2-deoxy-ribo-hexuluronate aminotransferase